MKMRVCILVMMAIFVTVGITGCQRKSVSANLKDDPKDPGCNKADVKLAINPKNHAFPKQMDACASKTWGNAKKTSKCIRKQYPELSESCAYCFGEMASCSASNCKFKCFSDHFSKGCLDCVNSHCREVNDENAFSLITCTGLSVDKLPPSK